MALMACTSLSVVATPPPPERMDWMARSRSPRRRASLYCPLGSLPIMKGTPNFSRKQVHSLRVACLKQ